MEKIEARDVNFYYGAFHALKGISMEIPQNQVVAFIGPSGCGKYLPAAVQPDERPDTRHPA